MASTTHAPISTGATGKADTHPVKRNYVPIKPAFRPLLPKPSTREPSPPNGIHIHTRATLNAGRKRLVSSKSLDAQKRRRMVSQHMAQVAAQHAKSETAASSPASKTSSLNIKGASLSTMPMSSASRTMNSPSGLDPLRIQVPFDLSTASSVAGTPSMLDEAYMSPPTPVSISESPQSFSMATIMDTSSDRTTGSPATIDPVCMVMDDGFGLNGDSLLAGSIPMPTPTASTSSMSSNLGGIDIGVSTSARPDIIGSQTLTPPDSQLNPFGAVNLGSLTSSSGFEAAFDDFSDFYFRDEVANVASADAVSNFLEPSLDSQQAGVAETEKVETGSEFSILDYLAPTNDLF